MPLTVPTGLRDTVYSSGYFTPSAPAINTPGSLSLKKTSVAFESLADPSQSSSIVDPELKAVTSPMGTDDGRVSKGEVIIGAPTDMGSGMGLGLVTVVGGVIGNVGVMEGDTRIEEFVLISDDESSRKRERANGWLYTGSDWQGDSDDDGKVGLGGSWARAPGHRS